MIAADEKITGLESIALFAGCSKRELRAVAHLCTETHVPAGFDLTKQGAHGSQCFVVAAGEASVSIDGRIVANVGPGACVGEMSLLDGGPRTATVTALTPMAVYVLDPGEFRSLLDTAPVVTRRIMTGLSRRLRRVETRVAA
jgi:CRP/FNR family cyclic AMP-dependent transcriptional regulator